VCNKSKGVGQEGVQDRLSRRYITIQKPRLVGREGSGGSRNGEITLRVNRNLRKRTGDSSEGRVSEGRPRRELLGCRLFQESRRKMGIQETGEALGNRVRKGG